MHDQPRTAPENARIDTRTDVIDILIEGLDQVLEILAEKLDDATTGQRVCELLAPHGDLERLQQDCAAIRVWSGGNHLPLLWGCTVGSRTGAPTFGSGG